jgi:hypothetical protein
LYTTLSDDDGGGGGGGDDGDGDDDDGDGDDSLRSKEPILNERLKMK